MAARDYSAFLKASGIGQDSTSTGSSSKAPNMGSGGGRDYSAFLNAAGHTGQSQESPGDPGGGSVIDKLFGGARDLASGAGNLVLKGLEAADLARSGIVAAGIEVNDALLALTGQDQQKSKHYQNTGVSFSDWLKNTKAHVGVGDVIETVAPDTNIWAKRALGFTGDVLADPLTYVGVGAVAKGGKAAATQGAKQSARQAGRRGGRRLFTKRETARRVLNLSDETFEGIGKTRHQIADEVLQGNSGALGRYPQVADAINADVGVSFMRRTIPGTQRFVARASDVSNRAKTPLRNMAGRVSDDTWRKLERVKGARQMRQKYGDARALEFIDSVMAGTRERVSFLGRHGTTLNRIINDIQPDDLSEIRFAIDEGRVGRLTPELQAKAHQVEAWLDEVLVDFNRVTGQDLNRLDNYFPREVSVALREHMSEAGRGAFRSSSHSEKRILTEGQTFLGETLQEGTVREIQSIADRVLPEGVALEVFLDDPKLILGSYLYKQSSKVREAALVTRLEAAGMAEEIRPALLAAQHKGARKVEKANRQVLGRAEKAGREARRLDDRAARAGDDLADISDQLSELDVDDISGLLDDTVETNRAINEAIQAADELVGEYDTARAVAEGVETARAETARLQREVNDRYDRLVSADQKVKRAEAAAPNDPKAVAELERAAVQAKERVDTAKADLKTVKSRHKTAKSKAAKNQRQIEVKARQAELEHLTQEQIRLETSAAKSRQAYETHRQQAKDLRRGRGQAPESLEELQAEATQVRTELEVAEVLRADSTGADARRHGQTAQGLQRRLDELEADIQAAGTAAADTAGANSQGRIADAWAIRIAQAREAVESLPDGPTRTTVLRELDEWGRMVDQQRLWAGRNLSKSAQDELARIEIELATKAEARLALVESKRGLPNPVEEAQAAIPEGSVVPNDVPIGEIENWGQREFGPTTPQNQALAEAEILQSVNLAAAQGAEKEAKQLANRITELADGGEVSERFMLEAASGKTVPDSSVIVQAEKRVKDLEELHIQAKVAADTAKETVVSKELATARKAAEKARKQHVQLVKKLERAKKVEAETWDTLNSLEAVDRNTTEDLVGLIEERAAKVRSDMEGMSVRQQQVQEELAVLTEEAAEKARLAASLEAQGERVAAEQLKYEAMADAAHTNALAEAEHAMRVVGQPNHLSPNQVAAFWKAEPSLSRDGAIKMLSPEDQARFAKNADQFQDLLTQKLVEFAGKRGVYGDPELVRLVDNLAEFDNLKLNRLFKLHDQVLSRWKAYALLSPGYHSRNFQTAIFMNGLAGMDSKYYGSFARYWPRIQRASSSGSPEALEAAFGRIKDPHMRQAFRDMHESRFALFGDEGLNQEVTNEIMRMRGGEGTRPGVLGASKSGRNYVNRETFDPTNLNNALTRVNFAAASGTEKLARGPLFLDTLMRGEGLDAAFERVAIHHFDYADLSHFEKKYMKRIVPFYTWTRKNFPVMLQYAVKKPGGFMWYLHAKRNLEAGVPEDEVVPGYFLEAGAIRLPSDFPVLGGREEGTGYLALDLPFLNIAEQFDTGTMGGQLSPMIKLPYEISAGKQVFNDIPFTGKVRKAPPTWSWFMPLLNAVSGEFGMPTVYKHGDTYLLSDADAYKIEQAWPLLGRLRRLLPNGTDVPGFRGSSEEKYAQRHMTSVVSTVFGVGSFTNSERAQGGELYGRQQALREQKKVWDDIMEAMSEES